MKGWGRWVPVGAVGVFAALFLALGRELSLSELLAWTPESPALAGLFLVGLYGLKSLSLVFPLLLLYLAAGAIFPLPLAFAVNTAGLAVCVSLPFFLGRWMGVDVQGTLSRRWPKLSRLEELEREALLGRRSGERARREAVRLGLLAGLGLEKETLERLVAPLSAEELEQVENGWRQKAAERYPIVPQLRYAEKDARAEKGRDGAFLI